MTADMTGRVAFVTGAASGLGRGTALAFAEAGADLFLVDRNADGLAETARRIEALGRRAASRPADLSRGQDCAGLIAAAVEAFGRLDALCNNAGLFAFHHSPEMPLADYDRMLAVNLSAPFHLSRAAIPHLRATSGAIVNVASVASFIGEAYAAAYCASKAGLLGLTKAMAMEYMNTPIRINAVAPGGMMTGIGDALRIPADVEPALIGRYKGMRGRVEVAEVAAMIVHLASDAGRAFHGACVTMDRGTTAG